MVFAPRLSSSSVFNIRDILNKRASRYFSTSWQKVRIVDKTILIAADDPDLLTGASIEDSLFRVMHQIVQDEFNAGQKVGHHVPFTSSDQIWLG